MFQTYYLLILLAFLCNLLETVWLDIAEDLSVSLCTNLLTFTNLNITTTFCSRWYDLKSVTEKPALQHKERDDPVDGKCIKNSIWIA